MLEPNSALGDPYEDDMSGAVLVAHGPDFKTVTVESVHDDSAAAEGGLKPGDMIETVDDKKSGNLTLRQIKYLFKQDSGQYSFGIRRGNDVVRLTIKLPRLI